MHNVIINGVKYVPIREVGTNVREAVARQLASLWWGSLGEDWEKKLKELGIGSFPVRLDEEESDPRKDVSVNEFIDGVVMFLLEQNKEPTQ